MSASTQTADVVVIGGGIVGLSAAWRLAQRGVRVVLLERRRCGRAASAAAAGVLAPASWQRRDPAVQFQRASLAMFRRFCEEVRDASGVDPHYVNCGGMELLFDDQRYRMTRSEAESARDIPGPDGGPVLRLLSPEEARQREPGIVPDILGARLCTFTSQVRNVRLLRGLIAAAQAAGVRIEERSEVTAIRFGGDRVAGAETAQGLFAAPRVVLCAGAWTSRIAGPPAEATPVYPVRGQVAKVRLPAPVSSHVVKHRKCYLVPRGDGSVIIGSTEEHEAGFDRRTTAEGIGGLLTQATRLLPPIARAVFVRAWAGLRPGTPDRRPYLGPVPGLDGLIAATGHFRTGIGLAPLTAEVVADIVVRGRTDHDVSRFAPSRELRV